VPGFDLSQAFRAWYLIRTSKKNVATYELLTPPLLLATFAIAFVAYCILRAVGRKPEAGVKHNELFGPFLAGFVVWLIGPIERLIVNRVSPNAITAMSLLVCVMTGVVVGLGDLTAAVWLLVIGGLLDVLDGRLARLSGKVTVRGALLDSVADRWGEIAVFAGYAWLVRDSAWLLAVLGAFGGSMMVSYTRARAEALGAAVNGGLMQRAERIVLVAIGTFVAAWYGESVVPILGVTMLLCAVASSATAIHRWIVAYRALAEREQEPAVVVPRPALPRSSEVRSPDRGVPRVESRGSAPARSSAQRCGDTIENPPLHSRAR
jgi:CDP-diacylglycerol--glycerol-3-phosphate 3-phosphatidyltransferase